MQAKLQPARYNRAFYKAFQPQRLTFGLVVPIERYASSSAPTMQDHLQRVQLAEELGFSAVWLRDIPSHVPSFGDDGQLFDPFVYLGYLAARTESIGLGVASIILPLRHPAHVAKAALSADMLSQGRLLLGVASGDRPQEYPALGASFGQRGQTFRDAFDYIRKAMSGEAIDSPLGQPGPGMEILPRSERKVPLLVTGGS